MKTPTPTTPPIRALTAAAVTLALALAPIGGLRVAHAAPANDDDADADADDDDDDDQAMSEAKQLFDAGVTRYSAAQYGEAVGLWLEAYDLIPPSFENRLIKAELIYNVARAQQKWFEIDKDVQHLRQSREILGRYLGEVDDLYGEQAAIEREKIEEQIAEVDEQIADWEAEQARREAELAERMRPKFDEDADTREAKRNKAMLGAGAGLSALGFGGIGLLVTGIVLAGGAQAQTGGLPLEADIPAREAAITRGESGNALMVTGTLVAGVFLAAGIPLLAVGVASEKKRKARRAEAGVDVAQLGPAWIPGGAGLSIGGRF
ncbi:hypothetical protein [Enhygromyxa salina]|uniref:Tetratricopeptide repeat protein n=1 Tax=Enhygromyxa salina TaxID=215803 RepID=A0A2S9YQI2_9BACT|nr:hypothetical protein [Enhygromyxa salina]PRQ07322.1 hypothetical protein ENSA7_30320 [Enhygromyxa salina]